MSRFQDSWSQFHGDHWPIGYKLRQDGAANWVRFHSLPQSKRYADSVDNWRTLLHRQNALAATVLGHGPCWLVQTHWVSAPGTTDIADVHDPFAATRAFDLRFAFELVEAVDDELYRWRVHAGPTRWSNGRFDNLLKKIADDEAGPTLWMAQADGSIFAPYDGGVDLFLSQPSQAAKLKTAHKDWLSVHPEGL